METPTRTSFGLVRLLCLAEYDPLEPNRRAVKARVARLRDPCSRVLDKRAEENGLLVGKGELSFCFRQERGAFFLGRSQWGGP